MKHASAFTLIVTFVCLALIGVSLIPLLPVKLNPSRTLPGFSVNFSMPGTSSRVVEMEVTSKLEAMLARISGVRNLNSNSGNGWGNIAVDLDKHADMDAVRFEASTIIRQTWPQLPAGVSYPIIRMKVPNEEASRPFITFTLNAPATPILIQQYAEEHIKPRLARIAGIYKVELSGATPMEWQLEYDAERLRLLGVTVDDIAKAVNQYYRTEFLGTQPVKDAVGNKQWIRLALMPSNTDMSFRPDRIVLTNTEGKLLRLDQLVETVRAEEAPQSYFRINGLNSIYLSITADEAANQLRLSGEIRDEMSRIDATLPAGYEVHTSYDATEYIRQELDKIYFRTLLTVVILLVFVWVITRRVRYLFLIVTSLVVNIAVALIFYYLFGLEMQLYSLAGITVSLNLVIDSTIVMTDHILHRHNLKAFTSVLAATLTTMGALVIIFFLDENLRLNLQDFAAVVIINLAVSLLVSLFFVPSLIDKIGLGLNNSAASHPRRPLTGWKARLHHCFLRLPVYLTRFYESLIGLLSRWRWAVCLVVVLAFAGTLYLFITKVYEGSYFSRHDQVVLTANANMPNGTTLEQMNTLIKRMESYLSEFEQIKQFHTTIYNARRATIQIYFTKKAERSGFPYTLKSQMISKALQLGGGSWGIYGLQDQGFSNDVRESAGSYRIKMYGYNYDELYTHAERLKAKLLTRRRIKEVLINSDFSWWKDDYQEYYFGLDKMRMAETDVNAQSLFASVRPLFGKEMEVARLSTGQGSEKIKLVPSRSHSLDVWAMQHNPYETGDGRNHKLSQLATVEKGQMPQEIAKENQQYRLCLQYEYIGSGEMGHKLLERDLEQFNETLPMGYTAEAEQNNWSWGTKDYKQYLLLLVVIAIIFFITSILFNSLKQPLAIIFVIPVSYIGVFLTFYIFGLNFDQGGFASFVLLCGITVNSSIYVLNEYNNLRRRYPRLTALRAYTKAWNSKVMPIFLTVVSTILGFIPFMVGTDREAFWFPLAAGTIGGLVMSVIAIYFCLPLLVVGKVKKIKA